MDIDDDVTRTGRTFPLFLLPISTFSIRCGKRFSFFSPFILVGPVPSESLESRSLGAAQMEDIHWQRRKKKKRNSEEFFLNAPQWGMTRCPVNASRDTLASKMLQQHIDRELPPYDHLLQVPLDFWLNRALLLGNLFVFFQGETQRDYRCAPRD